MTLSRPFCALCSLGTLSRPQLYATKQKTKTTRHLRTTVRSGAAADVIFYWAHTYCHMNHKLVRMFILVHHEFCFPAPGSKQYVSWGYWQHSLWCSAAVPARKERVSRKDHHYSFLRIGSLTRRLSSAALSDASELAVQRILATLCRRLTELHLEAAMLSPT